MGGCGSCGTSWIGRIGGCPKKPHDQCSVCGAVYPKNHHEENPICGAWAIYRNKNFPKYTAEKNHPVNKGRDKFKVHEETVDNYYAMIEGTGKEICSGLIVPAEEYKLIKKHRKELSD
jgi:hypothetical protein